MKKSFIYLSFLLIALSFAACKKDQDKITLKETVAAFTLNPLSESNLVLLADNKADTLPKLTWDAPDYGFSSAITYTLQMDKKGNSFSSAVNLATITQKLSAALTTEDLNKNLLVLGLDPEVATVVEIRVKASINDKVDPVYSNTIEVTVTPYATAFPPIYLIGDDTGGWNLAKAAVLESTAPSVYSVIVHLTNNKTFRFFTSPSWTATAYNYPYFSGGAISALFENANDGDKNFRFIGATGFFKITVNLKTLAVNAVAVDEPVLFMTGEAFGGWDWTTSYKKLSWQSDGIFMDTTDFINNATFRFFKQPNWGNGYCYNDFIADSISTLLVLNTNDADNNFKFVGTSGKYIITVNLKTKVVKMVAAPTTVPDPTLTIIGSLNSWNTANAINMPWVSGKIFTITQVLTNGDKFRFFETADWSATQYNFASFSTVNGLFSNDGTSDQNFIFNGTTGNYTITVDLTAKTFTLESNLYIVGSLNSWSLSATKMTWVSDQIYKTTQTLTNGDTFRFFADQSWSATQYNYPYFSTIDASFANDGTGDQNLKFNGATGSYTLTVNLTAKTMVLAQP
jgi:hypothetical protein